ncbi:hypothetical protein [Thermostichus sp. MS-CIW-37]
MTYSSFTLERAISTFQLRSRIIHGLFAEVPPTECSDYLKITLDRYLGLATSVNSEKARSEFIIAPVLGEVKYLCRDQISLFSGKEFNVDPERGLVGLCDYIICLSPLQLYIQDPVVIIVEAKKEDLIGGLGQCVAGMVGAQVFNKNSNSQVDSVYGAVTSGTNWRFAKFEGDQLFIDDGEYFISEIAQILGILLSFIKGSVSLREWQTSAVQALT